MKPCNNKIIVRVDQFQKDAVMIGDNLFRTANLYDNNYRYKSPTIATVVEGNEFLQEGDILLCHHNLFYLPSPYSVQDDLFSIPFSKIIFAKILSDGSLQAVCGNLLGEKIEIESYLPLPIEQRKQYNDRFKIIDAGWTKYKVGQIVFARPFSTYDIIFHWNGVQKTATKISEDMITGYLKD